MKGVHVVWFICGSQRQFMGAISFFHVGLRNQTQIMRLEGKCYHREALQTGEV